jgi:hypothetical protein
MTKINQQLNVEIDQAGDVWFVPTNPVEGFYVFRDELPRLVQVLTASRQVVPDARDIASDIQDILDEPVKSVESFCDSGDIGWNQSHELSAQIGEVREKLEKLRDQLREAL